MLNRTVFRDGKPRAPDRPEEFEFFPDVEGAIADLRTAGFAIVVVTNQPDVARGWQTRANVEAMNAIVREKLAVDALKVCFHDSEANCACRKPLPGMLVEAARELEIDLVRSIMIGDRESDPRAGVAAGCGVNLFVNARASENGPSDGRFSSLGEAVSWILSQAKSEL